MANPMRGEVTFNAGDDEFTLRCTVQALAEIEAGLGKPLGKWVDDLGAGSVTATGLCLSKMLVPSVTVKAAYELIGRHSIEAFGEPIVRALVASGVIRVATADAANPLTGAKA